MPDAIVDAYISNWVAITPLYVAATFFYAGAVIWLHAWRAMWREIR